MTALLLPLLAVVAYFDLRYMRIPDRLTLAALALFLLLSPTLSLPELAPRLLVAGTVFSIGVVAFALGLFGGGDVKFLPALLLFVPPAQLALFSFCLSGSILLAIASVTLLRSRAPAQAAQWAFVARPRGLPLGLSFALAGFAFAAVTRVRLGL